MEITNERPSTDVILDIDFTEDEYEFLLNYAKSHMPEEELNKCYVEWAVLDAIKTSIETKENEE